MAVLSWGEGTLKHALSINGAPSGAWTNLDVPRQGSVQLTVTEGDKKEAKQIGGRVVDVRKEANSYQFTFTLFMKKGVEVPSFLADTDGVIAGEHAWQFVPEDPSCWGFQIDRSSVSVAESFDPDEDGYLLVFTVECIKPASGNTVKRVIATAPQSNTNLIIVDSAGDTASVTVTVANTATALVATTDESWITVPTSITISEDGVTHIKTASVSLTISANATTSQRSGTVTLTDSNSASTVVSIMQAAGS